MKKRVLAVVLCLAMLIGYVPYFAFTAQASNSLNIYHDGVLATSASLPQNKSVVLDAAATNGNGSQYQWQIQVYGDFWVDITGGAGSSLKVTYAMIASLCNSGAANLRVKAMVDGVEVFSSPFAVYVTDPVIEPTEDNSEDNTYVIQDAPDAIIHDTPVSETTAPTTAPTEAATEAPTEAATEGSSAADVEAATAAYNAAAAAYDMAVAELEAKQDAYETAVANRAAAEEAVQASAVVTTTEAVYGTDENGETYEISPATTTVTYDAALEAAAEAAASEEAAAQAALVTAQNAFTAAEANLTAAETALNAAKSAAVTQPAETTPVSQAPSSNFGLLGSSNYNLTNEPAAQDDTPVTTTYNVVVNYVSESNEVVADPYTASLAAGSSFSATVTFPTVQGYLPYLNEVQQNSLGLNFTAIDQNYTYNVVYKPTNVNYTVIHYQQNLYDDNYTEIARETKQGLTKSQVPEVAKSYEGFYALLYERPNIAADGSTLVEVYYDRYYYLMNFDLGGGYGVDPIYARYGTPISNVGTPTLAGYTFKGWSLNGSGATALPIEMPAANRTYTAIWEADNTAKVTVVFWGENADDEGYSYIKSAQVNVKPGTEFTYSESGGVICGQEGHTHSIANNCYQFTCTQEEHTHDDSCYTCGQGNHTHDMGCYNNIKNAFSVSITEHRVTGTKTNGSIGQSQYWLGGWRDTGTKYIYINGTWYGYTGSTAIGGVAPTTCEKTEGNHNHTDACLGCGETEHTHSVENGCYKLTCTKTEHSHTSDCYMNGAGLDADKWKFVRSDTVTVAADGSTVVNVYYDRVEYSVQFYTRENWPTEYTDLKITAKWGANILKKWPTYNGSSSWYVSTSGNTWQNSIQIMPVGGAKFYGPKTGSTTITAYYYVEVLPGEEGTVHNGVTYKLHHTDTSSSTGNVTSEDKYDIQGFTYKEGTSNGSSYNNAKFYYTRNVYGIEFFNPTALITTVKDVPYESPLERYDFVPGDEWVPEQYEPGSVKFAGWYLNPECSGEQFDLSLQTMPLGAENHDTALSLYAKWVPVEHTVTFYLDQDAMNAGNELSTHPSITVPHGSKAVPTPTAPTNGSYTFVGWFYMDGGVEKTFDFANMPVNKDLQVYGKWSSNVLKEYFIYYKIQGTDTEIADPTTGSGLAGTTKTFDAKGGTDLYADYQEGYFPVTKSHSLTINIEDETQNSYTFWYVQKEAVPYTVKYLNKETGAEVAPAKTVSDNRKAVVTETFVPVNGMMPDAYQKRLVVSVDENGNPDTEHNVIIFYYTEDTTHAYYKITHYTENVAKDAQGNTTWTEYASSQAVGDIGTTYTADPMTIPGFTYDSSVTGTVASGELTSAGLELKLYYTRNSYPYQVRYLEQGTGKKLADPKNGTGKYGQVVSESAIDITNYTAVDPTSTTLNIRIEESATPALNIITFYYTENEATINYVVVGPDGCGTVSPTNETLKVLTGTAQGSTAAVTSSSYKFVGWYSDAFCTEENKLSTDAKYTPTKAEGAAWVDGTTYYAKFEWNVADLTITKQGSQAIDEYQSFIFTVTGADDVTSGTSVKVVITGNNSVTIKGLLIGAYTVTEDTNWSWRYETSSGGPVNVVAGGTTIIFNNSRNEGKWLSGDSVAENQFTPVEG